MKSTPTILFVLAAAGGANACGSRPADWQASTAGFQAFGLTSVAVVVDDPANRALALIPRGDQTLAFAQMPVGHHVLTSTPSHDSKRLFVLSAGDTPRRSETDQRPSLTVVDGSTSSVKATNYKMSEPLGNLAVDPSSQWVAAFASPTDPASLVENPNEIVLFDLTRGPCEPLTSPCGPPNPIARNIRSFGGTPQRLTFTPPLQLPGGSRRLLVIETDRDVTLLDLDHAAESMPPPEITVQLTTGTDTRQLVPAGVAVNAGDPTKPTDYGRIAVRTTDDTNVMMMQLVPASTPNGFQPTINLVDVGAVPTDVAFVQTDGGLRVAALLPTSKAVLVEPDINMPDTSVMETVSLPAPYAHLSLVTSVLGSSQGGGDVALLWGAPSAAAGVALWSLGETATQAYLSVEVLGLPNPISSVLDVPQPHPELKLLETSGGSAFYVLDLIKRTAPPLATQGAPSLSMSPDGARVWAYSQSKLSQLDLQTLDPVPLYSDAAISAAFDVARDDGGRSLIALHDSGAFGATVFDAIAPDTAKARIYSGLLLEGL